MTEELNWLQLADQAQLADPGLLKRQLDLVAVCEEIGILLEEGTDGKYHGLCPFHDDNKPSFDVYERPDGTQACGCLACDFGGSNDVYDLLRAMRGYGFADALKEAQSLAAVTRLSNKGPRQRRVEVDLVPFVEGAVHRAEGDALPIATMLSDRGLTVPVPWLVEEFRLGLTPDGAGVVVPHYAKDGSVLGAKVRRANNEDRPWKPMAVKGSQLSELYGVWRDQGRKTVFLVEGESDTWTAAWLYRHADVEVFGLPSGAAARPRREWLSLFDGRDVTLMFDADDGGRVALKNWAQALGVVRVVQLDEGHDVSSTPAQRIVEALGRTAVVGLEPTPGLIEAPFGGYVRVGDQQGAMIANFTLRLERTIDMVGEGHVFDVALPDGRSVSVETSDFKNDATMRNWANKWGYVWNGGTKDVQELLRMLRVEGVFRPLVRGTKMAGWNDDCYVFPEPHGTVGGKAWAYVPPVIDGDLTELLALEPGKWDFPVPALLAKLHRPDVITPLLGWIAAAPLRAFVKAFPMFAIVGGAGWGKTTLVRETLETFGFKMNLTLTTTTPHGVSGFIQSTNAIPLWVDEYRVGARADTKERFDQLLRDAWESSASYKGGLGEQRQALTKVTAAAPIIITGEDAFVETSHLERMCIVQLPRTGRDPQALEQLSAVRRDGFGRAYLEWLTWKIREGALPQPPMIRDRPRHARAVAAWGYALFELFVHELLGYDLPAFDGSLVEKSHTSATPIALELLATCENRPSRGGPVVWREGEDICARLHDLIREAHDLKLPLPGNARASNAELSERYELTEEKDAWGPFVRLKGAGADV